MNKDIRGTSLHAKSSGVSLGLSEVIDIVKKDNKNQNEELPMGTGVGGLTDLLNIELHSSASKPNTPVAHETPSERLAEVFAQTLPLEAQVYDVAARVEVTRNSSPSSLVIRIHLFSTHV